MTPSIGIVFSNCEYFKTTFLCYSIGSCIISDNNQKLITLQVKSVQENFFNILCKTTGNIVVCYFYTQKFETNFVVLYLSVHCCRTELNCLSNKTVNFLRKFLELYLILQMEKMVKMRFELFWAWFIGFCLIWTTLTLMLNIVLST